jgi:hypothetical protein
MSQATLQLLQSRIETIEESYEFMLAYAAQGVRSDQQSGSGPQLRDFLARSVDACDKLADLLVRALEELNPEHRDAYEAFAEVLKEDGQKAKTALQLVLVQPNISSQLIDNVNALIHLRAVLTDLFVVDEVLKSQVHIDA